MVALYRLNMSSSRDDKNQKPYDFDYYLNNKDQYPTADSKQVCPTRDPFGKDKNAPEMYSVKFFPKKPKPTINQVNITWNDPSNWQRKC